MAHEWHTEEDRNPLNLIKEFIGFKYNTDYGGGQEVTKVNISSTICSTHEEAISFVRSRSYYGNGAYLVAYTANRVTKGYLNAFNSFLEKYNEYVKFKNELTIAYGRTASKVTCPDCSSSINLKYGKRFKVCPICGSKKIISDSNWKTLDTKQRMSEKAAETLRKEAEKNNVTFVCGIEWHC